MKKIFKRITFIFIVVLISQESYSQEFILFARSGLNVNNVFFSIDSATIGTKKSFGFEGSLGLNYHLNEYLGFNSGLGFTQKGFSFTTEGAKTSFLINYIHVPFFFDINFDLDGTIIFFNAGGFLSYGVNGKISSGGEAYKISFGSESGQFEKFDSGMLLGWGLEFENIQVGVNYNFGFKDIASGSKEVMKTRSLLLFFGYKFN
jgi:hypothetical protein